ncbi:ATP-binding protein [Streptomyces zaehneri]|uniref:ATP-binding protein n=1 Tax=Streptomyces zaehneri TaxID=3051180 RepID=UPI0028CFE58B|nr:ATP-binding protein [Streptomyces sp. DSM 40713]
MNSTESLAPVCHFAMRFSSTPRGARLARRMCGERLDAWGIPFGSDAHGVLTLVAAELCANAVRHGHVAGRDFHVRLSGAPGPFATTTVRVEVTDTRGERLPTPVPAAAAVRASASAPGDRTDDGPRTGGRGLLLVDALADRWGCTPRVDGPGKTVWAECVVPGGNR